MFEEIHPHEPPDGRSRRERRIRNGREGRTARKVSPRLKGWFAAAGFVICAALAVAAWAFHLVWLAIPLTVLAVWALIDVLWQWHRWRRGRDRTRRGDAVPRQYGNRWGPARSR